MRLLISGISRSDQKAHGLDAHELLFKTLNKPFMGTIYSDTFSIVFVKYLFNENPANLLNSQYSRVFCCIDNLRTHY